MKLLSFADSRNGRVRVEFFKSFTEVEMCFISDTKHLAFLEFITSRTQWNVTEGFTSSSELARATNQLCRYPGLRYPNGHVEELQLTSVYWHLVAIKLGFVFFFENFVVAATIFIKLVVTDVPSKVKERKLRESYVTRQVLNPNQETVDIEDDEDGIV